MLCIVCMISVMTRDSDLCEQCVMLGFGLGWHHYTRLFSLCCQKVAVHFWLACGLSAHCRKHLNKGEGVVPSSSIHFMVNSWSLSMEHMSLTCPYRPSYETDGSKWVIMMSLQKTQISQDYELALWSGIRVSVIALLSYRYNLPFSLLKVKQHYNR